MSKLIKLMMEFAVVPIVNTLLQTHMIPLPVVKGLDIGTPLLTYGQNFVAVAANFTYIPPTY
jgi:hypothetical protein